MQGTPHATTPAAVAPQAGSSAGQAVTAAGTQYHSSVPPGQAGPVPGVQYQTVDAQYQQAPQAQYASPNQPADRSMGTLSHILGPFVWLVPLIVYLVKNGEQVNRDEFQLAHLRESANMALTWLIATFIHGLLMLVLIGILTFMVHWILYIVWAIQANSAMGRGEMYSYPLCIKFFT
jgi:uncharacterized Tic20 family protein